MNAVSASMATSHAQAGPASAALLAVNNIEVVYNHAVQVLRGLSLSVPPGRIVALLGSNGAGKSTTLKAVSNLLSLEDGAVTAGHVHFAGQDIGGKTPHSLVRAGLGHVMEGRRVFEDLTVEENLVAATYALTGRGRRPGAGHVLAGGNEPGLSRNRAEDAPGNASPKPDFDLVYQYFPRLHERRRGLAGYLSGGEQQMLAIGRALIGRPSLMLLDEPSLGLSPMLVENIFTIIARINAEQGVAMLLVEQNASLALAVADYGYIMESGKVVIDGTAERLAADPDVREFYLGVGGAGESRSFRDVKHFKRRKRWLS